MTLRALARSAGVTAALGLLASCNNNAISSAPPAAAPSKSDRFVGRYDGSSFETAMGMILHEDRTFEWGVSVGALDMRSRGTWRVEGDTVLFNTDPKPVPAEFRLLGIVTNEEGRIAEVVRVDGTRFTYVDAFVRCADGSVEHRKVAGDTSYYEGMEDEVPCPRPVTIQIRQSIYDVDSPVFNLAEIGWEPGKSVRFEFVPNDLGVIDLTGMRGTLSEGVLTTEGPFGRPQFRKLEPQPDQTD